MEFNELIKSLELEKKYAKDFFVPIIRDKSARFLYDYVNKLSPNNILEIGTAIGYSGSIMLSACDNATLYTVDINEKSLLVANNTFEKLGYKDRVYINKKDALDYVKELAESNIKFDFVFLDGPKGQYISYLPYLTKLLSSEGVIFADNVLLDGMVESNEKIPHRKRTMVVNLRKYLEVVNNMPYETELIRLEDGIAITKLKEKI